ncbi:MAG: glycoside hydrolase family 57 protein [Gammaproteobacteria bacterium]|nr:glycoside hydrolase family 57 protein [Gammaproteobacteria bacterium]
MSAKRPLKVVLCWHMHQPYYRDEISGQYRLPWTYLHAIKDYVDMVALLEENPAAVAVVNFTPTLMEQISDYARQITSWDKEQTPLRDPLLAALISETLPASAERRRELIAHCLRANEKRMIHRFRPYRHLAEIAALIRKSPASVGYISDQYLADLLVWYHLAWLGETVRTHDPRVMALLLKQHTYSMADREQLLQVIGEQIDGVLPRYRRLAEEGRIELSVTPYGHPIIPLMLDMQITHQALPEAPLPANGNYPGGLERARWHIEEGLRVFEEFFGFRPRGCWPSEGAVSEATLALLSEANFDWAATGESVLHNSLQRSEVAINGCIHRPFRAEHAPVTCFFRDDGLSDLIGFTYAEWHSDDALDNLIHHLKNIATACADEPDRVVPIIMDGENAWEYYPENGYHFLTTLYQRLVDDPEIELTTFSQCLDEGMQAKPLKHLVAGSWVYGTFSTWIGDAEKNHAWELLTDAKTVFDRVMQEGELDGEARHLAERQLAICEGSDWFWWFGDYNPSESVKEFDALYRHQLQALYRQLGVPVPASLSHVISTGGGQLEAGGVMRRGQERHGHHD